MREIASAYRPIRARLAGQWDAGLKNISIIWISGRRRGGIVWVNPSSKCASCHSHEMHQRIIHMHVNVSSKAYVYDENIYNFCARARFPGCTYLRHIILGLNTVCRMLRIINTFQKNNFRRSWKILHGTLWVTFGFPRLFSYWYLWKCVYVF